MAGSSQKLDTGSLIAGTLTFIALLIGGIAEFTDKLSALHNKFGEAPTWVRIAVFVGLAAIATRLLIRSFRRRSSLRQPRALDLDRDRLGRLVASSPGVTAVEQHIPDWPITLVTGELEAGKTATVVAGLLPRLVASGRWLVVRPEGWGADWDRGPRQSLALAIQQALHGEDRAALGIAAESTDDEVIVALPRACQVLARRALVVLNDVDIYLARHRERFCPPAMSRWLTPTELVETNGFWRLMRDLLESGRARCVMTCASAFGEGLGSLQVSQTARATLPAWDPDAAEKALDEATSPGQDGEIITDPERGWALLRRRLVSDLAEEGPISTDRLVGAATGLTALRYLTVTEYARLGGLAGLEKRRLTTQVASAAQVGGLQVEHLWAALACLADRRNIELSRKSAAELVIELPATRTQAHPSLLASLETALARLARDEVVVPHLVADDGSTRWSLRRRSSGALILAASKRDSRSQRELTKRAREFRESHGLLERWEALLPPRKQLRFARERISGRLFYGDSRRFALLSIARLLPMLFASLVAAGVIAILLWGPVRHHLRRQAALATIASVGTYVSRDDGLEVIIKEGVRDIGELAGRIRVLDDLVELDLADTKLYDKDLRTLSVFPKLKRLDLSRTSITDDGAQILSEMRGLEVLKLGNNQIQDAGIAKLSRIPGLRVLDLSDNRGITDDGVGSLGQLLHLETLDLTNTVVTGAFLSALGKCTKLHRLVLTRTPLNDSYAQYWSTLQNLEYISLKNTDITDATLSFIGDLPKLRTLTIPLTRVTGSALVQMKNLPQLEELYAGGVPFLPEDVDRLRGCSLLRTLWLPECGLTNTSMDAIGTLATLEDLRLSGNAIDCTGIRRLANLRSLTALDLAGTDATDDCLSELAELENLVELDLAETQVRGTQIMRLSKLKKLVRLSLPVNVSDKDWRNLQHVLGWGG